MDVEGIKPYGDDGSKAEQVRVMFDSIAPAYDFMNRAMTLGIDKWWRRAAVKRVKRHLASVAAPHVLDVATGTGDFALQLRRGVAASRVEGIDLSEGMLAVARAKVDHSGLDGITFTQGDCLALPYDDASFDAVTVAFGVRNFERLDAGYAQMFRVLRPAGMLCVVELSTPRSRLVRFFYDLYTLHIIPWVGSLKSGDSEAYRYLPRSIAAVPQGERMLQLMRDAGFEQCRVDTFTLGTCSVYVGVKPRQ